MYSRLTLAVAVAFTVAAVGVGACSAPGEGPGPPPAPVAAAPVVPAPVYTPAPDGTPETLITRPGMYEVGTDIKAGKWKTYGPVPGDESWSVSVWDADGTMASFTYVSGPATVAVAKGQALGLGGGGRPAVAWFWVTA